MNTLWKMFSLQAVSDLWNLFRGWMASKVYAYEYPRPAIACDFVLVRAGSEGKEILLVKRKNEPYKDCWALPGGFMEIDETTRQAAIRELAEETGCRLIPQAARFLGVFDAVARDPRDRVVSVAYYYEIEATDPGAGQSLKAADDAIDLAWRPISLPLPGSLLAFDHQEIVDAALNALKK